MGGGEAEGGGRETKVVSNNLRKGMEGESLGMALVVSNSRLLALLINSGGLARS